MSTMEELRSCKKFFITPCEHPERLGFDTLCVNNRVKINRASFIRFLEGT